MKGVIKLGIEDNKIKSFDIEIECDGDEFVRLLEALGIKAKV